MNYPSQVPRPPGEEEELSRIWQSPTGWRRVTDVNNTYLGLYYIGTAILFLLLAGSPGAGDAGPARGARERLRHRRHLQPDLHHARHGDDVPLRRAGDRGRGGLPPAADAGRAGFAVPPPLGLRLLGLLLRRHGLLLQHLLGPGSRRRLVHVPAADELRVLPRHQRRLLAARHRLHRDLGHRRCRRAGRRHSAHPSAGHVAGQDAGLCLGHAGRGRHDRLRLPAGDPGDHAPRAGARLPLALLHRRARRRPAALAAPVLAVRPSRGLHHLPARGRHGLDDRADDGASTG